MHALDYLSFESRIPTYKVDEGTLFDVVAYCETLFEVVNKTIYGRKGCKAEEVRVSFNLRKRRIRSSKEIQ